MAQYMNFDESSRLYPEREPGKAFPVTTPLEKTLLIIIAIVVAIGIGLTICLVSVKRENNRYERNLKVELKNETNVCFTSSCITEASNLLKSMDMGEDPCTDFYSFACGNWIKNAHLVSTLESQFTKLTRIITLRVKEILEDLEKETDIPEHKEKTKKFYKSCMDKAHRNQKGAKELLSDLKKFGGWPLIEKEWKAQELEWADLIVDLFNNGYIDNMLFTLKVETDAKNTSRTLISVSQPSLGLKYRLFYAIPHEGMFTSYKEVLFKLAMHLNEDLDKETSMADIEEAFKLELKIANLTKEISMNDLESIYNIKTLEELETFAPKIPWRKLLKNMLPPNTDLTKEERIMITVPSMIKGLNTILEEMDNETDKRTLFNYILYRAVFDAANHLSKEFYVLVNDIFNTDSTSSTQLWEICVKASMELFPLPLTSSYVSKYMDNSTKDLLRVMVDDIKNALRNSIEGATWPDTETKDYALLKVDKMRAAIAYQDEIMKDENLDSYYSDVNITDDHFSNVKQLIEFKLRRSMDGLHETRFRFRWTDIDNLLTANAYYQPGENSIIIPVGVLQDTVFAAERPNYINYGSLGMIVGHELTHAFDSIGSLYDAEGNYRMWWTENSWKRFEDKMKCYEEQYNNYYVPLTDSYINGTLTLGENIADNGGLQTAYDAYKTQLKRMGSEKSLPGLPYNEKQMFWISFASVWCRKQTEESIQYAMKHSVHTLSQFRIIGSLSNMKEFSEDFKCKLNSTMNPASKCFLWK